MHAHMLCRQVYARCGLDDAPFCNHMTARCVIAFGTVSSSDRHRPEAVRGLSMDCTCTRHPETALWCVGAISPVERTTPRARLAGTTRKRCPAQGAPPLAAPWQLPASPPAMLHCSVICSLMIAIFICEQPGTRRLVDIAMPSCFPDSGSACAVFSEQCA
ncbi:hypothetical protein XspCFBP7912_18585 [Xanthomonas sp. CFBP 7912]|nr:hypothetical protein XspCFBP7912_18585 [Xanthomonas sp. CFBP 7912]RJS02203.1 hypothetical protein XnspCFBP7698_17260 [Xanthomonas sp. CFBP 7698]